MQFRLMALPDDGAVRLPEPLGFGRVFTRRTLERRYDTPGGWGEAVIGPAGGIALDAAANIFHSGQGIFEGTKAYLRPDGRVQLFRPDANAARFNASAARLAMPSPDPAEFVESIDTIVALERAWVPPGAGASLYIRPFLIGTEATLEVRASRSFLFSILLSPAGPYFASGFQPIGIRVEEHHVRAAPGGTGAAKTIGNYAASLAATEAARGAGYQQVLWLDAIERRVVEEAGSMNIAFVTRGGEIFTPALSGSILPGITRDSVLRLAPDLGFPVREARIDVDEVLSEIVAGRVTEVFCMGTAAVIVPVGRIGRHGRDVTVADGRPGPVTAKLYDALTAIQYGRADDPYGWTRVVDEPAALARCVA